LQSIFEEQKSNPDIVVAYFYFDFNDTEKQPSSKALRALLFQLALRNADVLRALRDVYQKCDNGQQQPANAIIRSLFQQAMKHPHSKYIVIDALDECTDREGMLDFIHLIVSSKIPDLHMLISSRPEKAIEDVLGTLADYIVKFQSPLVDKDIGNYVKDRLATDPKLKRWSVSVREEIAHVMQKKAGGM
jgi:hypothetical protein